MEMQSPGQRESTEYGLKSSQLLSIESEIAQRDKVVELVGSWDWPRPSVSFHGQLLPVTGGKHWSTEYLQICNWPTFRIRRACRDRISEH